MSGGNVPVVKPMSKAGIETVANTVLFEFAPDCLVTPQPVPVIQIFEFYLFEKFEFEPEIRDLGPNYEGLMDPETRTVSLAPAVYEAAEQQDGRARFTVSHEIGHVVMHAGQLRVRLIESKSVQLARRIEIEAFRDPEWQANAFAAALLMPEKMVRKVIQGSRLPVLKLQNEFQVSAQAAQTRLKKMGI